MKYTVVLLRPKSMCNDEIPFDEYGQEIYVAHVEAELPRDAVEIAQREVFDADIKDNPDLDVNPFDYRLCILFDGHINPVLYGWQL